jgi:hypothetical protein
MRIEGLDFIELISNFVKLSDKDFVILPWSLTAYQGSEPITFTLAAYRKSLAIHISCEDPSTLERVSEKLKSIFGGG